MHLALTVDATVTLVSVVLIWFGLRPHEQRSSAVAGVPFPKLAGETAASPAD